MTIDFNIIKVCIIASPGYVKDEFFKYLKDEYQKKEEYTMRFKKEKILEKIMLVRASSGYKSSLAEVLQDATVQKRLENTKAIREIKALEHFYNTMREDDTKVTYGPKHVFNANE